MNRKDFFRTLFGGASLAAASKAETNPHGWIEYPTAQPDLDKWDKILAKTRDLSISGYGPVSVDDIVKSWKGPLKEVQVTYSCEIKQL